MNLNRVIILGNVAADPERRSLPSGDAVVNFRVATNRFYTDREGNRQQETEFHNIVAFRRLAEIAGDYLSKGDLVLIEGHLQTRSWEDPKTGRRQFRTEIITDNIQLPPRKWKEGSPDQSSPQASTTPKQSQKEEDVPVLQIEEDSPPQGNNDNDNDKNKPKSEIDPEKDINI